MSKSKPGSTLAHKPASAGTVALKLEVVVLPVADVDRALAFYGGLGWRQDADFSTGDDFRVDLDIVEYTDARRFASSSERHCTSMQ